ncbi:alpha-glucosidase [Leptospira interrogans]|uniref:Alpha-glucosidase n=3 Tax=Leptospira interrogans TaxID=173 RepID=Q72TA4_LEPIC|nr:alpha-glucosidase [Leptospira interrogans]APH41039.1 Glycosyl hydrolase, family 31 [Leptospira interrogans serovar Copenhageni/Icterohaemorrhagiae]AAS69724.1 alpha-glucosidase [Leptospira interrogans serovar Copenhageni str. Fiocruz L1-130]ARB97103.2 alpha-glucosidase [Leptospira interrogans serovar Copenhageni]ASP41848.1 alpha-glucosidase [Leptospira interrogans]EKP20810.1 glycosyl hydrolase, family 31 [Leptospira interrogans serovar Icterohaemorrhagiae str. Verdun LP]
MFFQRVILAFIFSSFLSCSGPFADYTKIDLPSKKQFSFGKNFQAIQKENVLEIRSVAGTFLELSMVKPFLSAAKGEQEVKYKFASFHIKDKIIFRCDFQSIETMISSLNDFKISGILEGKGCRSKYEIVFIPLDEISIRFKIKIEDVSLNRSYFRMVSDETENIFGLGEQFSHFNLKGKTPFLFTEEQGVGRGDQPITTGANLLADAGGNEYTTYAPIPFFLTSKNRSVYFENSSYSKFDFSNSEEILVEFRENGLQGIIWKDSSPIKLVQKFTEKTGRTPELPDWAYGTWLGIQGGKEKVLKQIEAARKEGNPITALWIQDWVGRRKTSFGSQLWWRWIADEKFYPEFKNFCSDLNKQGIHVLGYLNPFLATEGPLYEEAVQKGYLIKDKNGNNYVIETVGFPAVLLDLTHPEAVKWIQKIIQKNLIGVGLSGWMADFGEWLPLDASLYSGISADVYHNVYPVEWARINREAIRNVGKEGKIVFFTRSGYSGSMKHSTLFWEGDQMVSWGEHDGIVSAVTALLSGGLSGISINHSDIGGYTTINNPIRNYHRSKELFLRWAELNVFSSVFRTHEGNRPEKNHQSYSDEETIQEFARYGKMHFALKEYLKFLIKEAFKTGLPVVRPLYLHYSMDRKTHDLKREFLLGEDLLVFPVLEEGEIFVSGYLPEGEWEHVWTEKIFTGKNEVKVEAPLGAPAIFLKKNGIWYSKLKNALYKFKK